MDSACQSTMDSRLLQGRIAGHDHRPDPAMSVTVIAMTDDHADAVLRIYQAGIDEGNATFEATAPSWAEFSAKRLPEHRFVALDPGGVVLGWTACTRVSDRCAYAGVVEHSVYVDP